MREIWVDVKDYEGLYQVSNLGNIKSLNYKRTGKEKSLKPVKSSNGYLHVILCKDGLHKTHNVHRITAQAFLDDYSDDLVVNHLNCCKTDNRVENLEMTTIQGNTIHACDNNLLKPPTKAVEVIEITSRGSAKKFPQVKIFTSQKEAADYLDCSYRNISMCATGRTKTCKGHLIEYANLTNNKE